MSTLKLELESWELVNIGRTTPGSGCSRVGCLHHKRQTVPVLSSSLPHVSLIALRPSMPLEKKRLLLRQRKDS